MPRADDTRRDVAHLLRRTGFGTRSADIDRFAALGYEAAVEHVCDLAAPDPAADGVAPPIFDSAAIVAARRGDQAARQDAARQARQETQGLVGWWLQRMVAAERPFAEKLAFLWHDHFATSVRGVRLPELLYRQHLTLRAGAAGRFDELTQAVAVDPAMLVWLDGVENRRGAPNENLARELFEVFTLGHGDGHAGGQPYTEADVADGARALTGWRIDPVTGGSYLEASRHDQGTKTVLGRTGALGVADVVATALAHPACAPYVVSRVYRRLARPVGPDDPVVVELARPFARDLDIGSLVRRALLHPDFRSAATRSALVKTPVEWAVGSLRALGLAVDEPTGRALLTLGQLPFVPPSVFGWPANEAWLTTAAALVRLQVATALVARADLGELAGLAPRERPTGAARLLGVESWGTATAAALADAADDPAQLLTIALVAPEHLLN